MKKIFIIPTILMLGVMLLLTYCDINKIGKDNVYIQIIEPTGTTEDKFDSGEVVTRYIYHQRAFDEVKWDAIPSKVQAALEDYYIGN